MRVTDCGCFGDFIKLDPRESFFKDILLTLMILAVLPFAGRFKTLFNNKITYGILGVLSIATIWFTFSNISNLPVKDFRPYKVGTNLIDCTNDEGLDPGEVEVKFVVEKEGAQETITSEQFGTYSGNGWKYKDRMDVVIREPESPKCKDFRVMNADGEEVQDVVLNHQGVSYWVNSYDFAKSDQKGFTRINELLKQVPGNKIGLTGTSIEQANGAADGIYEFYNLDATPIKTMNRANPGLTVVKNGVIIGKYHNKHLPSAAELKELTK